MTAKAASGFGRLAANVACSVSRQGIQAYYSKAEEKLCLFHYKHLRFDDPGNPGRCVRE